MQNLEEEDWTQVGQGIMTGSNGVGNDGTSSRNGIGIEPQHQEQTAVYQHDKSCVIRRGDSILLINRRRTRAMVLKFRSIDDCLSFSDRFIQLNPWPTTCNDNSAKTTTRIGGAHATATSAGSTTTNRNNNNRATQAEQEQQQQQEQEQDEVMSYIVRLMHEPSFLQLVHKIENLVTNTTDGNKMLQALDAREL